MSKGTVEAAGGILLRGAGNDRLVAMIHRERYNDWSFPKGKADNGETTAETAIREVEEETGVHPRIIGHLGQIEYPLSSGATKQVDFFVMRPTAHNNVAFVPNDEVDLMEWVRLDEALERLTYERDKEILTMPRLEPLSRTGRVHLFRHAHAGSRSSWESDDTVRPLTSKGEQQAKKVAKQFAGGYVDRIYSSPYDRCVQSVEPLSKLTGVPIEHMEALTEGSTVDGVIAAITELAGLEVVMCSHGDVIREVLRRLERSGTTLQSEDGAFDCQKASVWQVDVEDGVPTAASYLPPPATS